MAIGIKVKKHECFIGKTGQGNNIYINIFHFRSNMLKVYQEKGWIDLPEGFAREMEIKKNNAGIGNTESIESNYSLTTD